MSKFSVGDNVVITGNTQLHHFHHIGTLGLVVNGDSPDSCCVEMGGKSQWISDEDLQLFRPSATSFQGMSSVGVPHFSSMSLQDDDEDERPARITAPKPVVNLETVILPDEKKEEIRAAMSQVANHKLIFHEWGFDEVFEKGTAVTMLFWGIPGTGKTLAAQAIADELKYKIEVVSTAEIESSEPGGAERNIKAVFQKASKSGNKYVLLFDECDSLLVDRNEVGPIIAAQINTLLTEIEEYKGVVIFTTNRLGKLDPALERRITAKIEFVFPDKDAREKIWKRMIPEKAPLDKDVDFKKLAEHAICGGNIKNAVLNAARLAAFKGAKTIKMEHFLSAIEKEAAALQSFVSEYENTSHTGIAGQVARTSHGITLSKKDLRKNIEKKSELFGKGMLKN